MLGTRVGYNTEEASHAYVPRNVCAQSRRDVTANATTTCVGRPSDVFPPSDIADTVDTDTPRATRQQER